MHRVNHLWEQLLSDENISKAIMDVNNSHHWRKHHKPNLVTRNVELFLKEHHDGLKRIMESGFEPSPPRVREQYDANAKKIRIISEPIQWPDQYVHHALIQVLKPILMRGMDPYCCGSIEKRGTHYGEKAIARWMKKDIRGTKYCLTLDIRHFYDSLKPEIVLTRMKQLIKDRNVLELIERVTRDGILIGAYTSQWFANTVLQPLDHLIREGNFGVTHYLRYMDNFTIFGANKRKLRKLFYIIWDWLAEHSLSIKNDWQIFATDVRLPSALGYRYGHGYIIPRKFIYLKIKRSVSSFRKKTRAGKTITRKNASGILSRLGILKHCNNYSIYKRLYKGDKVLRKLKNFSRYKQGGCAITWNTYLAQTTKKKHSAQKARSIQISQASTK